MYAALPEIFVCASVLYNQKIGLKAHVAVFQGISQTLIIARIGISRFVSSRDSQTILASEFDDRCDAETLDTRQEGNM
jgi:hypothetical protein